jgi:hypothetical protein
VTRDELSTRLNALSRSVARLNIAHAAMETEVPLYSVGGLALAVASLGESVTYSGLRVHAAAFELRDRAHQAAGLVSPEVVRYVHTLITTGRAPGQEVGRWG